MMTKNQMIQTLQVTSILQERRIHTGVEARRNRCCRHYSVDQLGDLNVVTALRCFSRTGVAISPGTLYAGQRSVGLLSVASVSKM